MASAVAHRATADAAEEEWIADTGATVTATTSSALVNPRTSNKVLLDFTNPASTRLAKVVFSGLRRAAGELLARRRGLGAGRGGHQEPNRKIRSEVPLALALRATARNRCGPTGCLAAC